MYAFWLKTRPQAWLIDGKPFAKGNANKWLPWPGRHVVRLVDEISSRTANWVLNWYHFTGLTTLTVYAPAPSRIPFSRHRRE